MYTRGVNGTTEVGGKIRAAREAAQLSQVQLAERLAVTQPTISRWELGEGDRLTRGDIAALIAVLPALSWSDFDPSEA